MLKRKIFVFVAALTAVAGIFFYTRLARLHAEQKKDERPNIIFILSDDQRWDTLGVYGNKDIKTPNLDALAKSGALFTNGYVAAPLCCPSRAAFLTGLYPHQTGVITNGRGHTTIPDGVKTIPQYLNDAGYLTGFVGKWHIDGDPMKYGFKDVPVYLPSGASKHKDPLLIVGDETKTLPGEVKANDDKEDEYHSKPAQQLKIEGMITPIFADAAIKFLDKHKSDRFFLWLATTAPHLPYYNDPMFPYEKSKLSAPPGWVEKNFSDADWAGYYSTISHLDEHLGRVLNKLRELGLDKNTVVIFTSDNGFMMGSHGRFGKAIWYEESVRVPWAIKWNEKIKPGTTIKTPIVSTDLLPTVLDIAGVKIPKNYEGVSALAALNVKKGAVRKIVYSEVKQVGKGQKKKLKKQKKQKKKEGKAMKESGVTLKDFISTGMHWQMVKTDAAKYVWTENETEMLYDLKKDPGEFTNVATDTSYEKLLNEMRALHKKWLEKTPKAANSN